jgi:D-hexose-6-phosphate mutarotase
MNDSIHLPEGVRVDEGRGGLRRMVIATDLADAEVLLHGAHVTHFQPRGSEPLLFVSEKAFFERERPIRGGVPICFPWFGPNADDPAQPAHGFARLLEWDLQSVSPLGRNGEIEIVMSLESGLRTRRWWPHDFGTTYRVTVARTLTTALEVRNPSRLAMRFEEALHTYFRVGDIRQTSVRGLEDAEYIDKMQAGARMPAAGESIRFTGETDRVYLDTQAACTTEDPVTRRTLRVEKANSNATVVWNPWIAKAKSMADFGDNEWTGMLCIETANVGTHAIVLPPGASHTMTSSVSALPT